MTGKKSDSHFVLLDNITQIVLDEIRLCIDKSDFNVKSDPDTN